jgi:hypothetical protein
MLVYGVKRVIQIILFKSDLIWIVHLTENDSIISTKSSNFVDMIEIFNVVISNTTSLIVLEVITTFQFMPPHLTMIMIRMVKSWKWA